MTKQTASSAKNTKSYLSLTLMLECVIVTIKSATLCFEYYHEYSGLYLVLLLLISAIVVSLNGRKIREVKESPIALSYASYLVNLIALFAIEVNYVSILKGNELNHTTFFYLPLYIFCISTTIEAVKFALLNAHSKNNHWLSGTNGKIGIPNWISISRIAISLLIPHVFIAEPFGERSWLIASIILVTAIATDKIDGSLARAKNQETRAGMALDPICDKAVFYPTAVSFAIMEIRNIRSVGEIPNNFIFWFAVICAFIIFTRDLCYLIWFVLFGKNLTNIEFRATLSDKVRMVALCAWLISTAISFVLTNFDLDSSLYFRTISIFMLGTSAAMSIHSFFADLFISGYHKTIQK